MSSKKIALLERDKFLTKHAKNAENLNNFFSNTVKNLKIPECEDINPFAEKLSHLIWKPIFKFSKHRSIFAINNVTKGERFSFHVLVLMMYLR